VVLANEITKYIYVFLSTFFRTVPANRVETYAGHKAGVAA
jgi:hypothetical protein